MNDASVASDCILVFLRAPDAGRVKTRLGRAIGDEAAAELYRCFVADLIAMLEGTGRPLRLFYTPGGAAGRIAAWLGTAHRMSPQRGSGLGERMANAFREVFTAGAQCALLVGTDVPDLPPERIDSAFSALARAPAVLTPTPDGGYCLIGFRADGFADAVFENQPWGTVRVLQTTLAAFQRMNRSPRLLDGWPDIDTIEDLSALMERMERSPAAAPKTAACLAGRFPEGLAARAPDGAAKFD